MKIDHDLEFLNRCSNEDLKQLCDLLTFDKKGRYRISEQLTNSDAYLQNYPDNMRGMTAELAEELQKFGTNSIMTLIHDGRPDSYESIVRRVCKKMYIDVTNEDDAVTMERKLLEKICEKSFNNMSNEELRSYAQEAGVFKKDLSRKALIASLMSALRYCPHILKSVVRRVLAHAISMLGSRAIGMAGLRVTERVLGVATGPVGWIVLTAWSVWDLASPAYRIVIPAVLLIAIMRYSSAPKLVERRAA